MQQQLISILLKNLDEEQLIKDIMSMAVKPAIDKFVAKTPSTIDDTIVALLYNQLSDLVVDELIKLIKEVQNG